MKHLFALCGFLTILAYLIHPLPARAAQTKGLLISPPRTYSNVDAGHKITGTFTIANTTDSSMDVALSVQQFSVNDYVYTQTFSADTQNWLQLETKNIQLAPRTNSNIAYTLAPPAKTAPGGYYYSIIASAKQGPSTMQTANLLYVTVNGTLAKTSQLKASHMPHFIFGGTIPYSFAATDTGNVHFFIYTQTRLVGLFTKENGIPQAHILLPGTTRTITGAIPSPILPGIYHIQYGYKSDSGETFARGQWVLYAPYWFLATIGLLAITSREVYERKKAKSPPPPVPRASATRS